VRGREEEDAVRRHRQPKNRRAGCRGRADVRGGSQ
jgi:hypothetical protein